MNTTSAPLDVFISYAAADETHKDVLRKHLALLKREGMVRTWHAGRIGPGDERSAKLAAHLEAAHIIILLISADYLATDTLWSEMERALTRHHTKQARMVPILLDACDWESAPFAQLMTLPHNHKPVKLWKHQSEAWRSIVQDIRISITKQQTLYATTTAPTQSPSNQPPPAPKAHNSKAQHNKEDNPNPTSLSITTTMQRFVEKLNAKGPLSRGQIALIIFIALGTQLAFTLLMKHLLLPTSR
ncbi:toll/interleukin-1 receptor domain-containing protein [Sorangium sp. So ce385]|uniref:toll/interleukin-1 receptor domain-containing protein n=1 Tax=Sorangium sp. So ce385 TaxID=3133308 RepID=UPI003F5C8E59